MRLWYLVVQILGVVFPLCANAQFTQQGTVLPLAAYNEYSCSGSTQTVWTGISSDGNTAIVSSSSSSTCGSGGTWVFTRIQGDWTQQAKFTSFGSVALSSDGNTALVGPVVFNRTLGVWNQGKQLFANVSVSSVALSGDGTTALFAQPPSFSGHSLTPGSVAIYSYSGSAWSLIGNFASEGAEATSYQVSLSSDGNTALVNVTGAYTPTVTVLQRTNGTWTQSTPFPSDIDFGLLSGDATTALFNSYQYSGVYPYANSGGTWTPLAMELPASAGLSPTALSYDGNTALLGTFTAFTRQNGIWSQLGNAVSGPIPQQYTSAALSGDGNTALLATPTYVLFYSKPEPLVSGQALGPVRNNYSGWVGGQFTVGSSAVTVTSLGRLFAPGDSAVHTVKLVRLDGSDLPGASVSVNMSGGTPGQYLYAPLANPIIVPPQTSYYLVSQETSGGDPFYDFSKVTTTADAVMNNPVYWDGSKYVKVPAPSYEYVPVNLLYTVPGATSQLPQVFITSPVGAYTYTSGASLPVSLSAIPANGQTIKNVQIMVDGLNQGTPLTTAPYTTQIDTTVLTSGNHTVTAIATDSANSTGTSPPLLIITNHVLSVSITAPSNGANVSGVTTLAAAVSAPTGLTIASVQFQVDTVNVGPALKSAPYTFNFDSTQVNNGAHNLTAVVTDSVGDTAQARSSFLVSNSLPVAAGTPLLSTFTPGTARNNYDGWVGMQFTVGSTPLTVSALGRIHLPGNSGLHELKIVQAGVDVPGSTVAINMSSAGPVGQYNYVSLITPVTLLAGQTYDIVSQEVNGGDSWYDIGAVSTTNDVMTNGQSAAHPVYSVGSNYVTVALNEFSYITANLLYSLPGLAPPAAAPFITTQVQQGPLRNNYSGHVGMEFTTGNSGLYASSLGRMYAAGNSQTHSLEFVRVSDDTVVGVASVTMQGGTPGQYQYASLSSTVWLAPNTSYYLVSSETQGGDQWFDYEPVTSGTGAVNGPVYSDPNHPSVWVPLAFPNYAYVPVNFQYSAATHAPPSVVITQPLANSSVSGLLSVSASVSADTGLSIASAQLQIDGSNYGQPNTAGAFVVDTSTLTAGTHLITVVATDSANVSNVSAPVSFIVKSTATYPLVISQSFGAPRNDFTGFVGMQITNPLSAITVNALGRMCLAGNSGTHVLKLVDSDGTDLASASVSLNMAGCTAGQYQYATLASPVAIPQNTTFLLVSQEVAGADLWYDAGELITNSLGGTANGLEYFAGGQYNFVPAKNYSYGPLNLLFQ